MEDFLEKVEATIGCLSKPTSSGEVWERRREIGIMAEGLEGGLEALGDSDFFKPVGSSDSSRRQALFHLVSE